MTKNKSKTTVNVVMYVGPSIPGVVEKGKIFNNGYTPAVINAIEKCSAIQELMVTTDKIGVALNDIQNKNGAYYAFASNVRSVFNLQGGTN